MSVPCLLLHQIGCSCARSNGVEPRPYEPLRTGMTLSQHDEGLIAPMK
jgi:hypothetical protein